MLISYNYLNLPKIITKTGTPRSSDGAAYVVGVTRPTASYIYLADGTKVQAIGETGQGYEYLGSLRLSVNSSNVDIESIPFAGGRIVKTTNGYEPQYYITDHLGSTRTVVKPNATVVAEFDYMPYGTQHSVAGAPIAEADYKYTGKEQQTAFGLDNLYDSQARFQYVKDGMFLSHDDLAEQFQWLSPYNYCAGNPIMFVDPDGRKFTLTSIPIIQQLLGVANEYEQRYNTELFLLRSSLQFGIRSDLEIAQIEAQMGQINQRINEIANMRQEIYSLMTSKQLYNITTNALRPKADPTIDIFGHTEYNIYNNYVSINICTNDKDLFWGTVAHELKHAYQFDAGQMSFLSSNGSSGWYYDYEDEIEAHRRGAAFGLPEDIDPGAYDKLIHKDPSEAGPISYINAIYNNSFKKQNIYRYNHFSYGYIKIL